MDFFNNKRGEMTSKMLISIILLVVGFGIILLIYSQLSFSGLVDREVCHESVVLRGTLPSTFDLNTLAPLKCKTKKICVRGKKLFGKGDCEEFTNADFVNNANVDDITQIERLISQEIVDCWSTMGEGKISLFSKYWTDQYSLGVVYPTCVICSRIAFDEETLLEKGIDLEQMDVLDYMTTHKIPNGEKSYYGYLAGEGGQISIGEIKEVTEEERLAAKEFLKDQGFDVEDGEVIIEDVDLSDPDIHKQELAIIFTQISAPSSGEVLKNTIDAALTFGLGVTMFRPNSFVRTLSSAPKGGVNIAGKPYLGGQFLPKKLSFVSKLKVLRVAPFAKILVAATVVVGLAQQGSVAYNRAVTAGYCGDVSTGGEERDGCSVVRTVNYNAEEISQHCAVIESIA